jgi:hypothetical protein
MIDSHSTDWRDPVIEVYKQDVDRALLRENLKMTPHQRLVALQRLVEFSEELQRGMKTAKAQR